MISRDILKYASLSPKALLSFIAALVVTIGHANAQSYTWENYNAIIFGNLSTNSDIEGRALVGGNVAGGNSFNVGIKMPTGTAANDRTFVVGGSIGSGNAIHLKQGSLYLGGSLNGRQIDYQGGGSLVNQATSLATLKQSFISESANFKAMATDSIVTVPTNGQPGPVTFNATAGSDGVAVFSISADAIFGNDKAQQIGLNANGATNIVINVSGTNVNWIQNAGNMVGDFNTDYYQAHIVWNFFEATTINLNAHNFNGSILAPNATVTTSNVIDGTVIANNLTTTGEVHLPSASSSNSYAGYRLQAVPEPGSALLVAIAGLMILTRRRSSLRR
ncbi:MAG: choice-of-anchor A family protein [Verrucomicrobium sp.]|nr:choice-of-anchor A family protein [Verrucomicrobium sp.]